MVKKHNNHKLEKIVFEDMTDILVSVQRNASFPAS